MGASAPSGMKELEKRAEERSGKIAITGRYHRLPKKLEDSYELDHGSVLGSGYNGQVYMATSKADQEGKKAKFAVKGFQLIGATKEKLEELEGECEIFLAMDHPHVARLTDVYETQQRITLVMECMEGGEVFKRVQEKKRFNEQDTATTVWQMLLAISYIHSHGIVHRDIKLENFLYESKDGDHLKLIDFGFSKVFQPNTLMHLSCGTLSYVAPEVLNHNYTQSCDMWSMGVVTFILLFGYMPFAGNEMMMIKRIKAGTFNVREDRWEKVAKIAQGFVRSLLVVDASKRLNAQQAMEHEFMKARKEQSTSQIDQGMIDGLKEFAQASTFRRAALHMMAWSLSNEERKQVRDAFVEMDTDKSGAISLGEFKKLLHDHFHVEESDAEEAFHALDLTHTEEIHYTEFLTAMVSTRIRVHEPLLKKAFQRFDADNSGYIDKAELKGIVGESFEGVALNTLMNEADTDNDGRISYSEWIAFVMHTKESDHHEAAHSIIDTELGREEHQGKHYNRRPMKKKVAGAVHTAQVYLKSASSHVLAAVHGQGHGKDKDAKDGTCQKGNSDGQKQPCCVIC